MIEMVLQSHRDDCTPSRERVTRGACQSCGRGRGDRGDGGGWRAGRGSLEGRIAKVCTVPHAPEHGRIVDAAGREVPVRDGHRITFDLTTRTD